MRLIRAILRVLILFFDRTFQPKALARPAGEQSLIDDQTKSLSLYHFEACPFCVRVRRHIKRLGLKIELRDVKRDKRFVKELVEQGGQLQVPCLRIAKDDGSVQWLYESAEINAYLDSRFAPPSAKSA